MVRTPNGGFVKSVLLSTTLAACAVFMLLTLPAQGDGVRFSEENQTLRTAALKLAVNQTSRVAAQQTGLGFKYFADGGDTSYMFDGSLIIGTSADDLSMAIFSDSTGHGDPAIGRLYSLSNMTFDTLPIYGGTGYRHAFGVGCNRDSSIAFDVDFYAPRHVDSSNFIVARFALYAGPKDPNATVSDVTIAYAVDWNTPDVGDSNVGGFDDTLQMVYQKSVHGVDNTRYGAILGIRDNGLPLDGGMVLDNAHWVDRLHGFVHDTLWEKIQSTSGYSIVPDSANLNSILVFSKTTQIRPKVQGATIIYVILASTPRNSDGLSSLKSERTKARSFLCNYLSPSAVVCPITCNTCGDANSDGIYDISDVVWILAHIFYNLGAADCNYTRGKADANGDRTADISDAIYLIAYIFLGGPCPHCYGMPCPR